MRQTRPTSPSKLPIDVDNVGGGLGHQAVCGHANGEFHDALS
jgi:hypothetical protein